MPGLANHSAYLAKRRARRRPEARGARKRTAVAEDGRNVRRINEGGGDTRGIGKAHVEDSDDVRESRGTRTSKWSEREMGNVHGGRRFMKTSG